MCGHGYATALTPLYRWRCYSKSSCTSQSIYILQVTQCFKPIFASMSMFYIHLMCTVLVHACMDECNVYGLAIQTIVLVDHLCRHHGQKASDSLPVCSILHSPAPISDNALTLTVYTVPASSPIRIVELAGGDPEMTVSLPHTVVPLRPM